MWLFALLVGVPIIEIALFVEVGGWLGLWPTLGIVIATAVAGAALLRAQGRGTLAELQRRLNEGGDPRGPIAHGALILVAGVVLLTPGFFTDAIGLALLIPRLRAALIVWGAARFASRVRVHGAGASSRPRPRTGGDVVEGEFSRIDDDESGGNESGGNESRRGGDAPPPR